MIGELIRLRYIKNLNRACGRRRFRGNSGSYNSESRPRYQFELVDLQQLFPFWQSSEFVWEVTRYPKNLGGADSRQHLPPGVQRCIARAARLQLPASRGPIRTAVQRVQ